MNVVIVIVQGSRIVLPHTRRAHKRLVISETLTAAHNILQFLESITKIDMRSSGG
jgi:ribose 1,5-bisphosphokinase PhnN